MALNKSARPGREAGNGEAEEEEVVTPVIGRRHHMSCHGQQSVQTIDYW